MTAELLATPFHARAAEANRLNRWENRGGFTLATAYGDGHEEAVAARFGAVMADVSWYWRIEMSGARAGEFVSRAFTRDPSALAPGAALEALWLNDGGGVRGAGKIVRLGRETFALVSPLADADWFVSAAGLYGVAARDATAEQGVLALIGPASRKILRAAGIEADVAPLGLRKLFWRGLDIALSRLGLGYEIWCEPDSALIVWDRLAAAGRGCALWPAGQAALDILAFESGVLQPGRDYAPGRDGLAPEPSAQSLGLSALIDPHHMFNGRQGWRTAGPETVLSGVLLDSETPVPNVALTRDGRAVGRILGSIASPAMRRAVAFAVMEQPAAGEGYRAGDVPCRVIDLPFLPIPAPMEATENPPAAV